MKVTNREVQEDLKTAKAKEFEFQRELEFAQKEVHELEVEVLALQHNVTGVGLPMSSYIRKIEVIENSNLRIDSNLRVKETEPIREILTLLKIFGLRIQQLELEVRKLKR